MIITINTKEDSREEIKKAIQMLMRLIEETSQSQDFSPVVGEGMFNIFGDNLPVPALEAKKDEEQAPERIEVYDY